MHESLGQLLSQKEEGLAGEAKPSLDPNLCKKDRSIREYANYGFSQPTRQ